MESSYQNGQKVITPEGEGLITDIVGEDIKVKLTSGEEKTFHDSDLQDDADAG